MYMVDRLQFVNRPCTADACVVYGHCKELPLMVM